MPHVGGPGIDCAKGLDPATLGLREIRLCEWAGLVFVNLDGQAETFDQFIAPLTERLGNYDLTNLHLGGEATAQADANWKIITENFVESYHLPWVHPTMNRFNPMEDHYQILGGDTYFGQGLLNLDFGDAASSVFPPFPNLTPEQMRTGESHFVFPNLLFGVMINFAFAIILDPDAVGRTRERAVVLVHGKETATDPALSKARAVLVDRVVSVNNEDMDITASVQRGRSSHAFCGGRFSPMHEETSRRFQQAYAIRMLKADGHPVPDIVLPVGELHHADRPFNA
jgi:choline monooxygenase